MAVERGDSTAPVGGTSSDAPTTFEQTTLKGTTSTGNAKLVKRDATEIDVIDTDNYWAASTVEGVLAEIGASDFQTQIDNNDTDIAALGVRVTQNEADIDQIQNDGATIWGNLIGTLSNQTDLQAELDARLSLDGTDTMTGAVDTSHGGFTSSKASSAADAPFALSFDTGAYGNTDYKYMEVLDSGAIGPVVYNNGHPFFGGNALVYYAKGYTGLFDSQIFRGGGSLGQILFTNDAEVNYIGFNPASNGLVTSNTSEINLQVGYGASSVAKFSTAEWYSPLTTGSIDLGRSASYFKDFHTSGIFYDYTSNGASAIGHEFRTANNFTTAGAKLASFKNQSVEKLSIDKDGQVTTAATSPTADAHMTRKDYVDTQVATVTRPNALLNTDFAINQRTYAGGALASGSYGYDRWASGAAGSTMSVSTITATIDNTTASTNGVFEQRLEGGSLDEGETYVLSWEGTAEGSVYRANSDSDSYGSSPITFTAPSGVDGSSVQEYIKFRGDGATLLRVKLEKGSAKTQWGKPDPSEELLRCQRYYYRIDTAGGLYTEFGDAHAQNSTTGRVHFDHPVGMRAGPTYSDNGNLRIVLASTTYSISASSTSTALPGHCQIQYTISGATAGQAGWMSANNDSTAYVEFDAEL